MWPVGRVGGELPTEEEDEAHQQGQKKTPLEPDSPLTSWEILSKFLDLSEPTPYPKNRNDNTASLPRVPGVSRRPHSQCLQAVSTSGGAGSLSPFWSRKPQRARLCGLMKVT